MDVREFSNFMEKFGISENKIREFIGNNKIFKRNGNFFLAKNMKNEEVYAGLPLFLKFKKLLPSAELLDFIGRMSPNTIELRSGRVALEVTYGKGISRDSGDLKNARTGIFYPIKFKSNIIGYGELQLKDAKRIKILMHKGEYLRES